MPTTPSELLQRFPQKDIEKRFLEINTAIILFQQFYFEKKGIKLTFIPDADMVIALKYFEWIDKFVKPFLKSNNLANAYKIASCTELVINRIQPIENQSREVNRDFAVFCAMNMTEGIKEPSYFNFDSGKNVLDNKLEAIEEDHRNYLAIMDFSLETTPPIVSNAAWWELLHLFYQFRFQAV
jgi:hypothetical protein